MLVDFFDAVFVSQHYLCEDETLIIDLELWNSKPAKIVFEGVIGFRIFNNDIPQGLNYETIPSQFFHDTLSSLFKTIPLQHEYKCYEIIDICDLPFIKVVARKYNYFSE